MIDWAKVDADGATEDERRQLKSIQDADEAFERGEGKPKLEALRRAANWISRMRMNAAMVRKLDAGEAWLTERDGRLVYQHEDLGEGGIDIGPSR